MIPGKDRGRIRRRLLPALACLLVLAAVLVSRFVARTPGASSSAPERVHVEVQPPPPPPLEPAIETRRGVVGKGDTLSGLLGDLLSPPQILAVSRQCDPVFPVNRMRAGRPYRVRVQEGRFLDFHYEICDDERLVVERAEDDFRARRETIPHQVRTVIVSGDVESNLYEAVSRAGESPELAVRLADIFAWDVDFLLDIRKGDAFKAVVEKRYRDASFVGYGRILAAEFVNRGKPHRGYLFEDAEGREGYYRETGESLRRAFLKAPLRFTRISSGFTWKRLHPIRKQWLPHPAIDYAAPVGTPVMALGDGVVQVVGHHRSNGRYVKIRHPGSYETAYLHLSRFARGLRRGKRVEQGEVIGYVGSSGLSTGPHLDFRMKKNGRYVNPRTLEAPVTDPVPQAEMTRFTASIEPLPSLLDADEDPPPEVAAALSALSRTVR